MAAKSICPNCNGTGRDWITSEPCAVCDQTGELVQVSFMATEPTEPTPRCRGCYEPNADDGFCPTCTARNRALTNELNALLRQAGFQG